LKVSTFEYPVVQRRHLETGRHAAIVATATALPEEVVTNQTIIEQCGLEISDSGVRKMFGVAERRVSSHGTVDSDLLAKAARRCLERARVEAGQLSKIIVTKFLGDHLLPMTAAHVQRKLECPMAVQAFDVDGGSNSFLQALEIANLSVLSGDELVLVVSGGITNRLVGQADPRLAFCFGDGAAAVLVGRSEEPGFETAYALSNPEFLEDKVGFEMRKCIPTNLAELRDTKRYYRNYRTSGGAAVAQFSVEACAEIAQRLLACAGCSMTDVDLCLIGEADHRTWTAMTERLSLAANGTMTVRHKYGNLMSATLPVLLHEAIEQSVVGKGSRIMLLSFGEGISAGGQLVRL
jgi:3-oxoacyl-[acyl-carrier-protein] synthase III